MTENRPSFFSNPIVRMGLVALVAAFATRESVLGSGDLVEDYRTAAKRVVQAIAKELH